MSFDGWLDARDGETLAREWATLGAQRVELGRHPRFVLGIQPEGAALLAAAFLGCSPDRFAWFAAERPSENDDDDDDDDDEVIDDQDPARWPPPMFAAGGAVARCFLDGAVDVSPPDCAERREIREVIDGTKGVQFVTLDHWWGEQTRDGSGGGGGSAKVVRLFDRSTSRGVSFALHGNDVWTIGEPLDLSPLDLWAHRVSYKLRWQRHDVEAVRGFLAQLTADLDAHFDTSTTWPGRVIEDRVIDNREYNFRIRKRRQRFEAGAYAIELDETLDPDTADPGMIWATVHGLPWGHEIQVRISPTTDPIWGVDGWVDFTLPRAQLDAAVVRLAVVPAIEIS